jgi:phage tail-like protein
MSDYSFFAINKKTDWEKGLTINLQITDEGIRIAQRDKAVLEKVIYLEAFKSFSEIVDFTMDSLDILYILDENMQLWSYDYRNNCMEPCFDNSNEYFSRQSRIKIFKDILYVIDPSLRQKVKAVSLTNGQLLWSVSDTNGNPLLPVDFTIDKQGHLYVITPGITHLAITKIDEAGRIINIITNENLTVPRNADIALLRHKVFVELFELGTCYILNGFNKTICKISESGDLLSKFDLPDMVQPYRLGIDGKGLLYIGELQSGSISELGDRTIKVFDDKGTESGVLSGYSSRFYDFKVDRKNRIYVYNADENTITVMKREQVITHSNGTGLPSGIIMTQYFDSTDTEIIWHKFELMAEIPKDTQIRVYYMASDNKQLWINDQLIDMDTFINHDESSCDGLITLLDPLWSGPVINPADALFIRAQGRYLWIKIELVGSDEKTPVLKGMKVIYPRLSYLRYLPSVYQEDEKSRDFLERFLSLFETFFSDMEDRILNTTGYFDPGAVSGDLLKWLAGWIGIEVDESWDEEKLRKLITKAPDIFTKRGTCQGIKDVIEVYTGEKPFIVEQFQLKYVENSAVIKDLFENLYGTDPFKFYVLVKPYLIENDLEREAVLKILDEQKPAYTEVKLVLLQPRIFLDGYTYMGINTYLSEHSLLKLDSSARIPNDTVLIDFDDDNQLEAHARLDFGAELK